MSRFDRRLKGVSDRPGSGVCKTDPAPFRMMGGMLRNRARRKTMPSVSVSQNISDNTEIGRAHV